MLGGVGLGGIRGAALTCGPDIPHQPASIYEEEKQTGVPGKAGAPHADRRREESARLL